MHRTVGVNVNVGTNSAGGLGLEHSVERSRCVLREIQTGCDAAVIRQHDVQAIFVQDMDVDAIEEIAILLKDVGFRAFTHDSGGWQHKHFLEFLNWNVQPHSLPWSEPPDHECLAILLVAARLVRQRDEEIKRAAGGVDGVREMPNPEGLVQCGPVLVIVFGELDLDRPAVPRRLFQERGFLLEGMTFEVQRLMIGKHRQQLPCLHLLAEIHVEFLNLVCQPFATIVDQLERRLLAVRNSFFGSDWRRGGDFDGRDKLSFGNSVDLLRIESPRQQVLSVC